MKYTPLPSQERLQELFEYSVVTGQVFWKKAPHPKAMKCKPGKPVGHLRHGHLSVELDGKSYQLHRLIWRLVTGEDPGNLMIDHKDLDKAHNAWHNLRKAEPHENSSNCKGRPTAKCALKGVHPISSSSRYQAAINHKGKQVYLGSFDTPEQAHAAYCKAAAELHGEFARIQ